jgi:hypothetical protein
MLAAGSNDNGMIEAVREARRAITGHYENRDAIWSNFLNDVSDIVERLDPDLRVNDNFEEEFSSYALDEEEE